MNKYYDYLNEAHTSVKQKIDRIIILSLLLADGRDNLAEDQLREIDAWLFDIAFAAKGSIEAAEEGAKLIKEGKK